MVVLKVENLCMRYGQNTVLEQINLELAQGEVLAVVGQNGSGKSTLLRLLAGLEAPHAGHIYMNCEQASAKSRAKFLSYMPQDYICNLPFTVEEMLLFGRSPWQNSLGTAKAEDLAMVEYYLNLLDINNIRKQQLNHLSGGQAQKAMLGRVLVQDTQVMLLDEPTSALDYAQSLQTIILIKEICQKQSKSAIVVLHDLNLAALCASKILALQQGKVARFGTPKEVLEQDLLQELYNCAFLVDTHPKTQKIRLSPFIEDAR